MFNKKYELIWFSAWLLIFLGETIYEFVKGHIGSSIFMFAVTLVQVFAVYATFKNVKLQTGIEVSIDLTKNKN